MKKVALVTGSSRGIGAAIAEALSRAGYAVCINYIERADKAEALADSAAEYLLCGSLPECSLEVKAGSNVGHVIPQRFSATRSFTLSLRVRQPLKDVSIVVRQGEKEVLRKKMRKALPAEMIQLPIKAEKLIPGVELEVSAE